MNIKQLIIASILSIGVSVIAFAETCPKDICDDANAGTASKDSLKQNGLLTLKPVTATSTATSTSGSNTDIPTYTVPKKALKK